jgi:hypothetical protein
MDKKQTQGMDRLAQGDVAPTASVLTPEVRSGSSFTFDPQANPAGAGDPAWRVVWAYRVAADKHADFRTKVTNFSGNPVGLPTGVSYGGTYAVTISGIAPDYEYRTYWGLTDLSKLQALNDFLHSAGPTVRAVLDMILPDPVMRSEIMGLIDTAQGIPPP